MDRPKKLKIKTFGNGVKASKSNDAGVQRELLLAGKQNERKEVQVESRKRKIQEMTYEQREMVASMDVDDDDNFDTMPPGDEGFDISHEGGEHEAFEEFAEELAKHTGRRRADIRDRRDRINIRLSQWEAQIDMLVDAYLAFKENEGVDDDNELGEGETFEMLVIDAFYRKRKRFAVKQGDSFHNVSMLRNGFMGSAPMRPTVAFSIRTLDLYRQTHRVCPRLGVQGQVKVFCHMHNVAYQDYLTEQFSIAYNIYLEIVYRVEQRVQEVLQHNTPNWRMLHACPACTYKLEGEPALKFSLLCEIDGNNSLKRTAAKLRGPDYREQEDRRRARTDYWLPSDYVDTFKDDVKPRRKRTKDDDYDDDFDDQQDITDDNVVSTCLDRWRNASPDERKRMFAMYDETGIFLAACRHGFVLVLCDMIKSGELSKYPLAVAKKLMDVFGDDIVCGYDIGCGTAFSSTVRRSSIGPQVQKQRFRCVVGSFHGHAHNRLCQLDWHPLYIEGMGRSDAEGCERVFAASNAVAACTRNASKFHRWQAIEEHFKFWDEDKYANLSIFLYNHYIEAFKIVDAWENKFIEIRDKLKISVVDFPVYTKEEKAYLLSLKKGTPENMQNIIYVESLQRLKARENEYDAARGVVNRLMNAPATRSIGDELFVANYNVGQAFKKKEDAQQEVEQTEITLGLVGKRWMEDDAEYKKALARIAEGQFRKAIDDLERLVVQRLFELGKLNLSGTGYKMRTHIARALQRRSEAIRSVLQRYNAIAGKLRPPRPQLDWATIVEYGFIGEFDLLRHSSSQVLSAAWTLPAHRQATNEYYHYIRAEEEIERLNVEIRRLRTSIHDEIREVTEVIRLASATNPALASEIKQRWAKRSAVQAVHIKWLDKIEALSYYSGLRGVGKAVNPLPLSLANSTQNDSTDNIPQPLDHGEGDDENQNILDDDELKEAFNSMEEFLQQTK